MQAREEYYFPRDIEWYDWLLINYDKYPQGINLIFYKLDTGIPTMRWEEAVKVALCFGWIDSTVKSLGNGKRKQYFCPRNPKSTWSKLNKAHVAQLEAEGKIQESGYKMIAIAQEKGTWTAMDNVENGVIPADLQKAFDSSSLAYTNYLNFAPGYRKSYLSWLHSAKRQFTRDKRISEIIRRCEANVKSRDLKI